MSAHLLHRLFGIEITYCGCCGAQLPILSIGDEWCKNCKLHVGSYGELYNRTYFALTGHECPYETSSWNLMDEIRSFFL